MPHKKSTQKITAGHGGNHKDVTMTLVRYRDAESLNKIRDAAAMDDLSLNKFIARASLAAANKKLRPTNSSSK